MTQEKSIIELQFEKIDKMLYPHQRKIVNWMLSAKNGRETYCAPTGSGKTLVMQYDVLRRTLEAEKLDEFRTFCIASHKLMLNSQHFISFLKCLGPAIQNFAFLLIDSRGPNSKFMDKFNKESPYLGRISINEIVKNTTSGDECRKFIDDMHSKKRHVIAISTYHSLDNVRNLKLDTFYADEAHHMASKSVGNEFANNYMIGVNDNAIRHFFFSATPKIDKESENRYDYIALSLDENADDENIDDFPELISRNQLKTFLNNEKTIFGELKFIEHNECIKVGVTLPPTIQITLSDKREDFNDIENAYLFLKSAWKKQQDLWSDKVLKSKMIVYCRNVDHMEQLCIKFVEDEENSNIHIFRIASYIRNKNIKHAGYYNKDEETDYDVTSFLETINELEDDAEAVIFNVGMMTDGIDIPSLTSVLFLKDNIPGISMLMQGGGRCVRVCKNDRKNIRDGKLEIGKWEDYDKPASYMCFALSSEELKAQEPSLIETIASIVYAHKRPLHIVITTSDDLTTMHEEFPSIINEQYEVGKKSAKLFEDEIYNKVNNMIRDWLDAENKKSNLTRVNELLDKRGTDSHKELIENFFVIEDKFKLDEEGKFVKTAEISDDEKILMIEERIKAYYNKVEACSDKKVKNNQDIEYASEDNKYSTPFSIIKRMIEYSNAKKGDKILAMYNFEIVYYLIEILKFDKDDVFFVSDSLVKNEIVKKLGCNAKFIFDKYDNGSELKIEESIIYSLGNMKFNSLLSNPPYTKGIDLKILTSVLNLADNIVFVHPSTWIYDQTNYFKNNRTKFDKAILNRRLKTVEIFRGDEIFEIKNYASLCISCIEKTADTITIDDKIKGVSYTCTDISSVSRYSHHSIFNQIKLKIKSPVINTFSKYNNLNYSYILCPLTMNPGGGIDPPHINRELKEDAFRFREKSKRPEYFGWVFNTENERNNAYEYCQTKFARFCLANIKINHDNRYFLDKIPWFDFSRSWTDEECAKELGITDEELLWMIQQIPDYYEGDDKIYRELEQKLKQQTKNGNTLHIN